VAGAVGALLQLVDDPVRRQSLSRAGLDLARTWPDEDDVADDVLAAYRQVVGASSAGH
jgi:hypothetical protein